MVVCSKGAEITVRLQKSGIPHFITNDHTPVPQPSQLRLLWILNSDSDQLTNKFMKNVYPFHD